MGVPQYIGRISLISLFTIFFSAVSRYYSRGGVYSRKYSTLKLIKADLNLHLEVRFERRQQCEKDGQREFKHSRHTGDAILRESNAEVLLDGVDEEVIGSEHGARVLQNGEEEL